MEEVEETIVAAANRGLKTCLRGPLENECRSFFVAVQYHPEFKSQPHNAHPLFKGFIEAALLRRQQRSGVLATETTAG